MSALINKYKYPTWKKPMNDKCEHSWIQDAPIKVCYYCGYKPKVDGEIIGLYLEAKLIKKLNFYAKHEQTTIQGAIERY